MPQVSIQIANRSYELACGDGEEERGPQQRRRLDHGALQMHLCSNARTGKKAVPVL